MRLGMIGLGRMGMNMARRLLRDGHEVVAYNRTPDKVDEDQPGRGGRGGQAWKNWSANCKPPRIVWIMLPAGNIVDDHIDAWPNCWNREISSSMGETAAIRMTSGGPNPSAQQSIHYLDAGVSGGIWGLRSAIARWSVEREIFLTSLSPFSKALHPKTGTCTAALPAPDILSK